MPKPLPRGRNQVLYNYGPGKVFFHEKSGMIERVVAIKQDPRSPDLRVNRDQLKRRIKDEIEAFAGADLDANLVDSTPVHLTQPDYVTSAAHPVAYYCQDCGHIYAPENVTSRQGVVDALRVAVPATLACTCAATPSGGACNGRLVQYDYLTTHNCGDELFVPSEWFGRCRNHASQHLHWIRQGSERASRWSIVCRVNHGTPNACRELRPANQSFFARHDRCPLDGRVTWSETCKQEYSTNPFMKATHYMPRVVSLLNSDNTLQEIAPGSRAAAIAAAGCLRDAASFRRFGPADGFDTWAQNYTADAPRGVTDTEPLQELQSRLDFFERHLPEGPDKKKAVADLLEKIQQRGSASGPAVSPAVLAPLTASSEYTRQVRDTTLYLDRDRSLGFDDFLAQSRDTEYSAQIEAAKALMPALHIRDIRYQERVPLTTALIGFVRGSYDPDETHLNLFVRRGGDEGLDVYASRTHTEALWIQIDPTETLRRLNTWTEQNRPVTGDFTKDLLTLQQAYDPTAVRLFGEIRDPWTQKHVGLLHTISHLFVKAAGRVTGLTQEGLGEEILPYTNGFLVYANQSGEFTLGGLQLMMEYHMNTVLGGLVEDAHRCPFDPVCQKKNAACPGCVHLAEVSCAHFNRTLKRTLLIDRTVGFWSGT